MEPDFSNVPYQAHDILKTELEGASHELHTLLTLLIENSDFLAEKAEHPIKSVQDLIDFLEDHSIYELEEILS